MGVIGRNIAEVDILPLPAGQDGGGEVRLASLRYQQSQVVDADQTASDFYAQFYKQTAISRSGNFGKTWEAPGLVTGYLQQTGSLAVVGAAVVLAFGHKDDTYDEQTKKWVMFGQRFIVSYDQGRTFSRTIFELGSGGMYAATVALPSASSPGNETLITVAANSTGVAGSLHVIRWRLPAAASVSAGGFFTPVAPACPAPPGGRQVDSAEVGSDEEGCGERVRQLEAENSQMRAKIEAAGL